MPNDTPSVSSEAMAAVLDLEADTFPFDTKEARQKMAETIDRHFAPVRAAFIASLNEAGEFNAKCAASLAAATAEGEALQKQIAILEIKNRTSLANNLCPDHRDKQNGKPCLACTIERLEARAAQSNPTPDDVQQAVGMVQSLVNIAAHDDTYIKVTKRTASAVLSRLSAQAKRIEELEAVAFAARKVTRLGKWIPVNADNENYASYVTGIVGTDWRELCAALAARTAGREQA